MAEGTEEKKHAPTQQRLKQLRDKEGQTARSKDFPSSASLIAAVLYLVLNFGNIWKQIATFFDTYEFIFHNQTTETMISLFIASIRFSYLIILPVALISSFVYIFASILQTKGIVLSFKSVAPNFTKLNPVEGLGNIFGLHGVSESIKIIIKVLFLGTAVYFIVKWSLNAIFWAPTCEEECVLQVSIYVIIYVIIAVLIVFFIVGVIDIWISTILFKHDNRMTETEMKREIKDSFGAKEIRQKRSELRNEAARNPSVRGFGKATVVVRSGQAMVGLAYEPGKYDIPIVVGKVYGEKVDEGVAEAKAKNVPLIEEEDLLSDLMKYTRVGEPIPQSLVMKTAQYFVKYGIVKRNQGR